MRRDAFADYCHEAWAKKYNYNPPWQKVDYIRLAKAATSLGDRANATWDAFLAEADPFYRGHTTGHFLAQLSKWVVVTKRPPAAIPEDEMLAARQALFAEVAADPAFATEREKRTEYVRRAIEKFSFDR